MAKLNDPVSDVMTRDPASVIPGQRLSEARALMRERGGHHIPVCIEGRFIGLLTPSDLVRVCPGNAYKLDSDQYDTALDRIPIREAMQEDVRTVRPQQPIRRAAELFLAGEFHCLPVVDESGTLVGMVTTTDLLKGWLDDG